ncbi:hypothetical protein EON81_07960 [bacterium]|nr:MAG: hypothetical protein EON81_07960 [bacterium]
MRFQARKLEKRKIHLRMALDGPTGAGKTYTGLTFACELTEGRILVIDTERSSADRYADIFNGDGRIDQIDLPDHSPQTYIEALLWAAEEKYEVVLVDSLSHAWMGKDGALEQVDKRSGSGSSFNAWRHVTPQHNALVDALLTFPGHLIATMRTKTEYVVEQKGGKVSSVTKVGVAPVQRDGIEYEFDIVGDMDQENTLNVSKTRMVSLRGRSVPQPTARLAREIREWLDTGTQAAATPSVVAEAPVVQTAAVAAAPPVLPETAYMEDTLGLNLEGRSDFKARCREAKRSWTKEIGLLRAAIEAETVQPMDLFGDVEEIWLAVLSGLATTAKPEAVVTTVAPVAEVKPEEPAAPVVAEVVATETVKPVEPARSIAAAVVSPPGLPSAEELIEQGRAGRSEMGDAPEGLEVFGFLPSRFPLSSTYAKSPTQLHLDRVSAAAKAAGFGEVQVERLAAIVAARYQLRPGSAAAYLALHDFLSSAPPASIDLLEEAAQTDGLTISSTSARES